MTDLWTPTNVKYIQSWLVGHGGESGEAITKHEFRLNYKGVVEMFGVLTIGDEGQSIIEDNAAAMALRSMAKIDETLKERGSKLTPEELADKKNVDVRRDMAASLRDIRAHLKRRRESSGGKIYYAGLN